MSQVEVSSVNQLTEELLAQLQEILKQIKTDEGLFLVCCLITDVQKNSSVLLVDGPEQLKDVIGYSPWKSKSWCYDCPGIVSRKKQLMPHMISVLGMLG